jgi:hypothetical protein
MGGMRNVYEVLVGKHEEKKQLGVITYIVGCSTISKWLLQDGEKWSHLAQLTT